METEWEKILARRIRFVLQRTEADFLRSVEEVRLRPGCPLGKW